MTVTIGAATISDLAAIVDLETRTYLIEGPWGTDDYTDYLDDPDSAVIVARNTGTVVGYAAARVDGHTCSVDALTVHPDRRSHGLGGRLLDQLLAWARHRHATRIVLQVRTDNYRAITLYWRREFAITDHLDDFYRQGVHAYEMTRIN